MQHWLEWAITRPVEALQKRIEAVGGGDFTADPAVEWPNELGDIGRGINKLAADVDGLMNRRVEDERKKQELEYRMLQSEVNPHFIYNTLNSIRWMATIQYAPGIAEMVTAFARLTKSISRKRRSWCPCRRSWLCSTITLPSSSTAMAAIWRSRFPGSRTSGFAGTA